MAATGRDESVSTQKSSVEQIWGLAACSRDVDEMKIKSEKQSSNVHEPGAEGGSSPLPFDPEKYRKYLAETGWSEKAQDEQSSSCKRPGSGVPKGRKFEPPFRNPRRME